MAFDIAHANWHSEDRMRREHNYYVYVLSNHVGTWYIGVTNNLERRLYEHRGGLADGFTKRYGIKRLVYFEHTKDVHAALAREMQLKGWTRAKKAALIRAVNPDFRDLSAEWR